MSFRMRSRFLFNPSSSLIFWSRSSILYISTVVVCLRDSRSSVRPAFFFCSSSIYKRWHNESSLAWSTYQSLLLIDLGRELEYSLLHVFLVHLVSLLYQSHAESKLLTFSNIRSLVMSLFEYACELTWVPGAKLVDTYTHLYLRHFCYSLNSDFKL